MPKKTKTTAASFQVIAPHGWTEWRTQQHAFKLWAYCRDHCRSLDTETSCKIIEKAFSELVMAERAGQAEEIKRLRTKHSQALGKVRHYRKQATELRKKLQRMGT